MSKPISLPRILLLSDFDSTAEGMSVTCENDPWLVLTLSGCDHSLLNNNNLASLPVGAFDKNTQLQDM
jgi:hypothetical protein